MLIIHLLCRLVPRRYLSVFWDERRLGIRLRRARGLMDPAHLVVVDLEKILQCGSAESKTAKNQTS